MPHVTVYVSADEALARTMLDAFTRDTGISVRMVGDTEAFKSTGLANRIRRERVRPVADVFWSSEATHMALLADEGLLEPTRTDRTTTWPAQWRDADHRWHGFSPRPRVIAFDPEVMDRADVPIAMADVFAPRFIGQVAIADPRFGTTGGHLSAIAATHVPASWLALLDAMGHARMQVLAGGNAATVDAVIRGDALLGLTDYDDVIAAQDRGRRVDMVLPVHEAGGVMVTPNTVGVLRGCPSPDTARVLVDWLLSDIAAEMLAASASRNMPVQQSVQTQFPELVVDDILLVDHGAAAAGHNEALAAVLAALRRQSDDS
ncbi:MAG: extracellular solute-binding protein [Phycisphaerales bacterium]|nr:extracellular solute-binding protein [Phycisphaerales bacterium]